MKNNFKLSDFKKNNYSIINISSNVLKNKIDTKTLLRSWDYLKLDKYIKNKFKYRYRAYSKFLYSYEDKLLKKLQNKGFNQSKNNNILFGNVNRKFSDISDSTLENSIFQNIINYDIKILKKINSNIKKVTLGIHQIRIKTKVNNPGIPAPEGVHCDGHNYLFQHLIYKKNVYGGLTVLFKNNLPIDAKSMDNALDTIIVNDKKLMHFATPINVKNEKKQGYRDMLLVDFKINK